MILQTYHYRLVNIVLKKIDEDTTEALSGVKFKLEKYNTKTKLLIGEPVESSTDPIEKDFGKSEKQGLATLNKYLLSGARFVLKNAQTGEVIPVKDNNGVYTATKNLVKGSYTLQELKAPKGYKADASRIYHFDFTPDKKNPKVKGRVDYHGFYDSEYTQAKNKFPKMEQYKANNYKFKYLVIYNEKDTRPVADLTVVKQDIANKTALADAEFELIYPNGITTESAITQTNGSVVFKDLVAGTYKLKETKAPRGYNKLEKEYSVTITPSAVAAAEIAVDKGVKDIEVVDGKVVVYNEKTYELKLIKKDFAADNLIVTGATLVLNAAGNEKLTKEGDEDNGEFVFKNLKAGQTYTLEETVAPKNYAKLKANVYSFAVDKDGKITLTGPKGEQYVEANSDGSFTVFNERTYDLKLVKAGLNNKDKTGEAGASLKDITHLTGAKFSLERKNGDKVTTYAAIEEDSKYIFKGLKKGTYRLIEEAAPSGYNKLIDAIEVVVDPSADKGKEVTVKGENAVFFDNTVVVFNEQQKKTIVLNLIKADMTGMNETDEDKLVKLAGAKFTLVHKEEPAVSYSAVTSEGKVGFAVSKAGIYTLTELAPPTGYAILAKSFEIVVTPSALTGQQVAIKDADSKAIKMLDPKTNTFVVFNEKTYDLKLLKADIADNAATTLGAIKTPLDGARFRLALESDTAVSYSAITGKEVASRGSLVFSGLKSGKYVLTEEAAPDNYTALMKSYTVVVTASALNPEFKIIDAKDGEIKEIEKTVVVFNKKNDVPNGGGTTPGGGGSVPPVPVPNTTPSPNPSPNPSTTPNPTPSPNSPTPTAELPRYSENSLPDPNDPDSPDEFVAVDEEGTPQGRFVKQKTPDGKNEYVEVNDDGTPKGPSRAKRALPKTGGTDNVVYYAGGAMLLLLAAGALVVRRKKYKEN